jgi:hypothetical protein
LRNNAGEIIKNTPINIPSFATITVATHPTNLFALDASFNTGKIDQGVFGLAATSNNIVCTAHIIDASATVPQGIDLHPIRFNPISGSQE